MCPTEVLQIVACTLYTTDTCLGRWYMNLFNVLSIIESSCVCITYTVKYCIHLCFVWSCMHINTACISEAHVRPFTYTLLTGSIFRHERGATKSQWFVTLSIIMPVIMMYKQLYETLMCRSPWSWSIRYTDEPHFLY